MMKIFLVMIKSLNFYSYEIDDSTGYGIIAKDFLRALIEYTDLDIFENALNILNFTKPEHYIFKNNTIGYTPWESTEIQPNWYEPMKRVDDLWTTSQWCADLFYGLVGRKAFVLPHGINENWTPIKHHQTEGPFTFVHVGAPAARKGDDILFNLWYKHFRKNKDVHLIFKCRDYTGTRIRNHDGSIIAYPEGISNISIIGETYNAAEMWKLYALSDCMVYPSRGEGFGLIPFEAMACGLPTILPANAMGDFTHHGIQLRKGSWETSTEQLIHPGQWRTFDEDEIIHWMEFVIENYYSESIFAYESAKRIHQKFAWKNIIGQAMDRLEAVFN